jgi:transposase
MRRAARVQLPPAERRQLEAWAQGPPRGRLALRAQIVLAAADGATNQAIAARLGVHLETAARWRTRFVLTGLEGISREAPRAGAAGRVPPATVRRIVHASLSPPPASDGRWTTRSLARSLRVNHMLVHRVWSTHGLADRPADRPPPRSGPRVELGGAFVTPTARAVVFTVDERPPPAEGRPGLPELVPNPTPDPAFSGPEERSREVVRTVRSIEAASSRHGPGSEAALLVFLRGLERTARKPSRLEVVFDRPIARFGAHVARWLAAHGRFRVVTPAPHQTWSGAVDAWLRRWEAVGLERGSLGYAPAFAEGFRANHRPAPDPASARGFSWGPVEPTVLAGRAPSAGPAPREGPPAPARSL